MNSKEIGKGNHGLTGAFDTLAITQPSKHQPKTNVAIPSDAQVAEAKDWVDHNKK